jgi:hypothetical protein
MPRNCLMNSKKRSTRLRSRIPDSRARRGSVGCHQSGSLAPNSRGFMRMQTASLANLGRDVEAREAYQRYAELAGGQLTTMAQHKTLLMRRTAANIANHTGGREPSGKTSFSAKLVKGTMQRLSAPSHRRQWGDLTLRMLVTPGSVFLPAMAKVGDGMPQRAIASSRTPSPAVRTIGAE